MKKRCFHLTSGFRSILKSRSIVLLGAVTLALVVSSTQSFAASSNKKKSTFNSTQQQTTVTGKVVDESGIALPGVTVVVVGTTNGQITDIDGNYTISNVPSDASLQFTFVGMQTQEVVVAGQQQINITMIEETIGLEEVIATGYATERKKDIIGSVLYSKYRRNAYYSCSKHDFPVTRSCCRS